MARILMTGVSSFTGSHIAKALVDAGHEVLATLTRSAPEYSEILLQKRLRHARGANLEFGVKFGSDTFLSVVQNFRPEVFVNHGAEIKGYRSPSFDAQKSYQASCFNIEACFESFLKNGLKRVIHSGSIFEAYDQFPALSPYGQSKTWTSERFEKEALKRDIGFSKIRIANPVGPFENPDRLIPIFVDQWKKSTTPILKAPDLIWDNVPAPWLARIYVEEVASSLKISLRKPSAFKVTLKEFVDRFLLEAQQRGHLVDKVYQIPNDTLVPPEAPRVNSEILSELGDHFQEKKLFDFWMEDLFGDSSL